MSGEIVRVSLKRLYEIWIKPLPRGKRGGRVSGATEILLNEGAITRFYEKVRKDEIIETEKSKVYELAERFEIPDKEGFLASVIVGESETIYLPSGDAKCGEIEVTKVG
jgi:hypothetical protein